MRATRRRTFEAAHRLPEHDGGCRRLHGHSYVLEVTMRGGLQGDGPQHGMVMDFSRIDRALDGIVEAWDHRTILWMEDPLVPVLLAADPESVIVVDGPPTAEYLAEFVGAAMSTLVVPGVVVSEVIVRETARGWATWTRTTG